MTSAVTLFLFPLSATAQSTVCNVWATSWKFFSGQMKTNGEQEVVALRITFKSSGCIGTANRADGGVYPLSYLPGTEEFMGIGRTRVSAVLFLADSEKVVVLLDGLAEMNWSGIRPMYHTVVPSDGGLGSEKWFERVYGKGPDPLRSPLRWAEAALHALLGDGHRLTGDMFTGILRDPEEQGRCPLIMVLDSDFCFPGHGAVVKCEVLEICRQADIG